MKKLRLKSQNFNIAMKELNFDISKWNLQQKAIFRSIYKIVPNDNDFIKNISKYLKENLDKNDLKELKRKTKKEIQKIDLKYFSNTLKREIKSNLENKNIDIKDIEILRNIYNDTWNTLLLFEIKKKRVTKDFLYIAHSKKQKEFEQFYLEKYKINLDFFAIEDKEKVKEIFKFNIDESVKKQLIIFTKNYVSTEIIFEDDLNNKIKIFV
ncbi:hypothetical protein, partial [Helcococcus bovis]|uniref:hypothetical protein n=1 Tax=Helcococcus bovis TaxID=3153252 RepID=UPI0038BD4EDA